MATKKKSPAKKKESAPVGRPSELVKLTSRDLTPGMQSFLLGLEQHAGMDGESLVEAMLYVLHRESLVIGMNGVANRLKGAGPVR